MQSMWQMNIVKLDTTQYVHEFFENVSIRNALSTVLLYSYEVYNICVFCKKRTFVKPSKIHKIVYHQSEN